MSDVYEVDFSNFGYSEITMAQEILNAYMKSDLQLSGSGMKVCLNPNSGFVFLSDEDYNVWMLNGENLEQFYSCPNCGHEGFKEEFEDQECEDCKSIFKGDFDVN